MNKMSQRSMINIFLNEPLNYERMLEIPTEELEFLKNECDTVMKDIKTEIIKEYESIKNVLERMRELKLQLKKLKERREIYKTFISIDKNQSILSDSSINSSNIEIKNISLSQLFKDIEDDKLIDEPVSNPIFKKSSVSKPVSAVISKVVIPESNVKTKQIVKKTISRLVTPKIYKK